MKFLLVSLIPLAVHGRRVEKRTQQDLDDNDYFGEDYHDAPSPAPYNLGQYQQPNYGSQYGGSANSYNPNPYSNSQNYQPQYHTQPQVGANGEITDYDDWTGNQYGGGFTKTVASWPPGGRVTLSNPQSSSAGDPSRTYIC